MIHSNKDLENKSAQEIMDYLNREYEARRHFVPEDFGGSDRLNIPGLKHYMVKARELVDYFYGRPSYETPLRDVPVSMAVRYMRQMEETLHHALSLVYILVDQTQGLEEIDV